MSDPHAPPGHPKTRRAQPLQPDKPAGRTDADDAAPPEPTDDDAQNRTQTEQALENVREGYRGATS